MARSAVAPMNRLQAEMDRLFEGFFGPQAQRWVTGGPVNSFPPLNVWEDADAFHVEAELPGLSLDDIELVVKDREVSLSGTRKSVPAGEGFTTHRNERSSGQFKRELKLPKAIDTEKVEATLAYGVLTLRLPMADSAKGRRISVKAG